MAGHVQHQDDGPAATQPWRDPARPAEERVEYLVAHMTLEEKVAQLVGLWVGAEVSGTGVAPHQSTMSEGVPPWDEAVAHGLGQLTRPFGTAPVDPVTGARSLAAAQADIAARNRWGIPAQVHEECLTGFAAWKATNYPAPIGWAATFDPALVERMTAHFGAQMRAAGVHQGLAPVLDVTRDPRWGRTEETMGEDPYLIGTLGVAYVRGLESAGIVATLKHFVGYSASKAGRNLAPVSMGRRELADVVLPPFEMVVADGVVRSVMHSYADIDGVPSAADRRLLTGILRDEWGFDGTVVADYWGIPFLQTLHKVADSPGEAARLALTAGVDVELPNLRTYAGPLVEAVREGTVDEALVDRALRRVLAQKIEVGLLDPDWQALPDGVDDLDLDDAAGREIALELGRESVVLLANHAGLLPLAGGRQVAVVGPLADDPLGMLGCYSFPAHVGISYPDHEMGVEIPTVLAALRARLGDEHVVHAQGCDFRGEDRSGIAAAVEVARAADVAVVVVGDRAGLFGRGTSGEGSDATDLELPGVQGELVRAILDTGTAVVLLLITGRPYALGDLAGRAGAVVQAFFPGQLGGQALAEILTGAISPSGRLPVSIPVDAGAQPATYLAAPLALKSQVSTIDPTPAFAFGHGLSYTSFEWSELERVERMPWTTDGVTAVELTVTNTGERAGTEVVQLYAHDPVAQVVRPDQWLIGYARIDLAPGERARVQLEVHADLMAFTGFEGRRIVEPGAIELRVARSSADVHDAVLLWLEGPQREVDHTRRLVTGVSVSREPSLVGVEEVSA